MVPALRELVFGYVLIAPIALGVLFPSMAVSSLKVKDGLFIDILRRLQDLLVSGLLEL